MGRLVRASSFVVSLAMGAAVLLPVVVAAQSDAIGYRPACELADDAAASAALGMDVVGDDSLSYQLCIYESDGTQVAIVSLMSDMSPAVMRLGFPAATDITIAGSEALAVPGDDSGTPPTVAVALEDGMLMVQVMTDAGLADPVAAATALAEALLAAGPVIARQPEEASGSAIEWTGDPCELVSLDELKGIVDKKLVTTEPDVDGAGCTYSTDPLKDPYFVNLTFSDGSLAQLRSGATEDLTVAGRSAVWWPDMSGLFVDAGGGRLFQVVPFSMEEPKKGAAKRAQEQAVSIAELAVGRMTPAAEQPTVPDGPTAGDCPIVSAEAVESVTGMAFEAGAEGSADSCYFVSSDQAASVLLGMTEFASLDAAWEEGRTSFPDLADPVSLDVGGHAAYGGRGAAGAVVVVDLAGMSGMDGKMLGVILFGLPSEGDQVEMARQLAEQAIAGM